MMSPAKVFTKVPGSEQEQRINITRSMTAALFVKLGTFGDRVLVFSCGHAYRCT